MLTEDTQNTQHLCEEGGWASTRRTQGFITQAWSKHDRVKKVLRQAAECAIN